MIQVYANTVKGKCSNGVQMIDFYPNVEIALMDISLMQRQNSSHRPYIYALASELPVIDEQRALSGEAWQEVDEVEIFGNSTMPDYN